MKKKIFIFTGAGISKESGITTFRDCENGLWNNFKIDDVATIDAWKKDREKVLNFFNDRRSALLGIEPNEAHVSLAKLESKFNVNIYTQNVDPLHELGGSENVYHVHGELLKARSCMNKNLSSVIDWDKDINIGDKHVDGSQLRPHIVLFGEMPYYVDKAYKDIRETDYLIIIGTSLEISYTIELLGNVNDHCRIIYIDPNPAMYLSNKGLKVEYVREKASVGVVKVVNELLND